MTVRKMALEVANRMLRPVKARLVSDWVWNACSLSWLKIPASFYFNGAYYPYFSHNYNCGWPAAYATERTVELALADAWLNNRRIEQVIEVGAVSPYYWPGRIHRIIDPTDQHPHVTDSLFMHEVDLTGYDVICISTLEHFGTTDYGLPLDDSLLLNALGQLSKQCKSLLATVPYGYSKSADSIFFNGNLPYGLDVKYLVRDVDHMIWREACSQEARCPYTKEYAASGVAVITK